MNPFRLVAAAAAVLVALVPVPAASAEAVAAPPNRINLPDGWQPEGITSHGRDLYVGSLADGAIWRADSRTGGGDLLARGRDGRVAVGVDHENCGDGILWVAGGATKQIRAHDAVTGRVLGTYRFPSENERFLNDIVVTKNAVYATDSVNQELAVVNLTGRGGGSCEVPSSQAARTQPLTGDLEYVDGFNLNGVVRSGSRLITVQSATGLLFTANPRTGATKTIDLGGYALTNGDGLELVGDTLYVVRNRSNIVAVIELADDLASGEVVAELTSDQFDVPTTITLARGSLWAVNARFGTEATPETPYWITRLDPYEG